MTIAALSFIVAVVLFAAIGLGAEIRIVWAHLAVAVGLLAISLGAAADGITWPWSRRPRP
jgi:steroid 5-alpha reductase family enzyme